MPVEVKAGRAGALRSLHQFVAEKHPPVAVRFDALTPSVQNVATEVTSNGQPQRIRYRLLSLPLYLVERLPDIVSSDLAQRD